MSIRQSIIRSVHYKWWVFVTVAIGTFITALLQYGVALALPTMASHFNADLPTIQWVIVAFSLSISVLLLPFGRLSDIFGRKKLFILGFVILVVGSMLAGFSLDLKVLLFARALQGTGSAMILANSTAITVSVFPREERGKALGIHMAVVGAGVIVGPAVGGFLVDSFGWRSVFFFNVPAGIITIIASTLILDQRHFTQDVSEGRRPSFDWIGSTLCVGTLLVLLLSITNGNRIGWTSVSIAGGLVASLILLATFIWWELRTPFPMLDLTLFRQKLIALGVAVIFIGIIGMQALLFITPFYLQNILGYSPRDMGFVFLPGAICLTFASPIAGRFSDRFGARPCKVVGLALSATALSLLAMQLDVDSSIGLILLALMLQSTGLGIFLSPTNSSILSLVEPFRYGVVSALLQLSRNLAHVASVALITVIVVVVMLSDGFEPSLEAVASQGGEAIASSFMAGLRRACMIFAILLLIGIGLSLPKSREI